MTREAVAALALLAPAALLSAACGQPLATGLLALPLALALVHTRRLSLSVPAQVLLALGAGGVAFVWTAVLPSLRGMAEEPLSPAFAQLAFGALLLAGLRLQLRGPAFGLAGTLGLGLLVFLSCGTVRTGALQPVLLAVFAVLAFAALRLDDVEAGGRPPLGRARARTLAATAFVVVLAGGVATSASLAIPRLYGLAYAYALDWVEQRERAGFHDGPLRLGALAELRDSPEVVLRVEGDAGERLRGNVYVHYARGRWLPAPRVDEKPLRTVPVGAPARAGEDARAVIRYAVDTADRFFLPSQPGRIRLAPAEALVDALGVVRTTGEARASELVLERSGLSPVVPAPPSAADLYVPDELRETLAAWLAAEAPASAPARVDAIRARLEREYVYGVRARSAAAGEGEATRTRDPLLDFLLDDKLGHCEWFASAMTLLARADGVPARLVTGYLVAERSPLGGYAIVRERHAHAWSEVHLGDAGWRTVDPSALRSEVAMPPSQTPLAAALVDYLRVAWQRDGPLLALGALVIALATVQLVRIAAARRATARTAPVVFAPRPWLAPLLARLAEHGFARSPSEPLEALARRVEAGVRAAGADRELVGAAELIARYAAWRYGAVGNADALRGDVERWLSRARGGAGA